MTETTLVLCKKPAIGVVMWLASMCVTNQALKETFVDLSSQGVILQQQIDIPMDEKYSFFLSFRPENQKDSLSTPVPFGSRICNLLQVEDNQFKPSLSLEVRIATTDGRLEKKELMKPLCSEIANRSNTLGFGDVEMKRGKYILTISNLHPVDPGGSGKVQAIFRGQGAGFP